MSLIIVPYRNISIKIGWSEYEACMHASYSDSYTTYTQRKKNLHRDGPTAEYPNRSACRHHQIDTQATGCRNGNEHTQTPNKHCNVQTHRMEKSTENKRSEGNLRSSPPQYSELQSWFIWIRGKLAPHVFQPL